MTRDERADRALDMIEVDPLAALGEVEEERDNLRVALDAAEAKLAVVDKFLAEREQCLTAIKNCPPDRVDYWRWQGHAEARRVLADDLGKDRVAQADDPDRGRDS